jgi:hypothetical protein
MMRWFEVEALMRERLPSVLADLVLAFCKPAVVPWDPCELWAPPEYDQNGNYGQFPMCAVDLPLFA